MNFERIYDRIKQLCKNKGITVSQLEKELGFSVGSIGKWRQYSPSIEKVLAVAKFFNYSLDELCCINTMKNEEKDGFLSHLYEKTSNGEIVWVPCFLSEKQKIQFGLGQKDFIEMYFAEYTVENAKFLVGISDYTCGEVALYISIQNRYFKQIESGEDLSFVWDKLKELEEVYSKSIDVFCEKF